MLPAQSRHISSIGRPGLIPIKILTFVVAGLLINAAATSTAAPPAPAKKDSRPGGRPKDATLTTSVEPAEARPGDIVTYKVTAKLSPGWHIYTQAKEQIGEGPRNTIFDLFDPGGLEVSGSWKSSKRPEAKAEPAFENKVFEFFMDEVTWSRPLKVPVGTASGKIAIRCQASYQICNENSCSFPGRWTLPDAVLTILPGGSAAGAASSAIAPVTAAGAVADQSSAPIKSTSDQPNSSRTPPAPERASPATTDVATIQPPSQVGASSPTGSLVPMPVAGTKPPISEIAHQAQQGLWPFLLSSAIGGLLALVMPCVWPMIPVTVSFFVKQGQAKDGRGKATSLAVVYCLAIIGIFTAVGVFCSFFFSASSLQKLANNFWLNMFVAGVFIAFGLSLLGLFEIRLPNFLLNASAQGESRGGLIGVFFMALTLTITSFSCTFPVVGGLIVMAAGGDFFYPILGLATFATVLALPFFLLALMPGLVSKLPRSGDWMNTVKIVFGLIEIGAALKFINAAEQKFHTPEESWFDAQVVLTSWVVLSAVCGIYLLGLFRTDHDHGDVKVGPGRIVFGSLFLILALFMAPALFCRPPQSLVWDRLIVGILPPDAAEFSSAVQLAGAVTATTPGEQFAEAKATSKDPAKAEREEKKVHGVVWGMSLDQAKERAVAEKRPILIDFTGVNCANCRLMESRVLRLPGIVKLLKEFVTIQLYTDTVPIASLTADQREELAERNQDRQRDMTGDQTNPFYVVVMPDGQVVATIGGYREPSVFQGFLEKALSKAGGDTNLAQIPASLGSR